MSEALSPFVSPQEDSAAAAIEAIREDLSLFDDQMERYGYIMDVGRKLPPFPSQWTNDAHRIPGCQSQVWLETRFENGVLRLAGASDAAIVSGLVALLLRVYSGRTPAEILETSPIFMTDLGLANSLSPNRRNGLGSMAEAIRRAALDAA